eukprot:137786-Alexandrium_andersonii.AAC.1
MHARCTAPARNGAHKLGGCHKRSGRGTVEGAMPQGLHRSPPRLGDTDAALPAGAASHTVPTARARPHRPQPARELECTGAEPRRAK